MQTSAIVVAIVGSADCGKTKIFSALLNFDKELKTVGIGINVMTVELEDEALTLEVIDAFGPGQTERMKHYYGRAHILLVITDLCRKESFEEGVRIIREINKTNKEIHARKVLLIGTNKYDDLRQIPFEMIHEAYEKHSFEYVEFIPESDDRAVLTSKIATLASTHVYSKTV